MDEKLQDNLFVLPIHFEYIHPTGTIRPRIAYGVNIFIVDFLDSTPSLNLGCNLRIANNLFISATSDIHFIPLTLSLIPRDILGYSLQIGVFLSVN